MTQDKDLQEIYVAWANQKFPNGPYEEVRFDYYYDHGYSEWTPGEGATIDIEGRKGKQWLWLTSENENNLIDLIHEIARFTYSYGK